MEVAQERSLWHSMRPVYSSGLLQSEERKKAARQQTKNLKYGPFEKLVGHPRSRQTSHLSQIRERLTFINNRGNGIVLVPSQP